MRFVRSINYLFVIGASLGVIFVFALPAYADIFSLQGERVMVAGLNVRTGPGTNYRRVGIIHKNEIYMPTGRTKGAWRQIYYDNNRRWIHTGYTFREWYYCVKVAASALNVRTGPSTRYRKVGVAMRNSLWAAIDCNDKYCSWIKIWYRSEPRWFSHAYLESKTAKAVSPALEPEIELSNATINNNADWTNSRYVTVHYDSTTTPEYYRISEDPGFSDANWIKAKGSKIDYTLSEKAGNKTTYLQFKNENGRLSNVDSDTIYYLPN